MAFISYHWLCLYTSFWWYILKWLMTSPAPLSSFYQYSDHRDKCIFEDNKSILYHSLHNVWVLPISYLALIFLPVDSSDQSWLFLSSASKFIQLQPIAQLQSHFNICGCSLQQPPHQYQTLYQFLRAALTK